MDCFFGFWLRATIYSFANEDLRRWCERIPDFSECSFLFGVLNFKPSDPIDSKLYIFHEVSLFEFDLFADTFDQLLKPEYIITKQR